MGKKSRPTLVTPCIETRTVELSAVGDAAGTFRKKILPLDTIAYPTEDGGVRHVAFDRAYLSNLIQSFRDKAYDAPTLQLADADNRHNMLPERTAGHIIGLSEEQPGDVDGPGLYADIRPLTPEHAQMLRDNPLLGVSAQIKENLKRVDGRRFAGAIRHVLATLDPRVVGLGAWREVSLSTDDGDPVIDLTGGHYEGDTSMGDTSTSTGPGADLTDDEIDAALEAAANELDLSATDDGDEPRMQYNAGTGGGNARVSLSTGDGRDTFLSLSAAHEVQRAELAGVQAQLAGARWEKDRLDLSNAGVPKYLLDEAAEVLAKPGEAVLSLSNEDGGTDEVDARGVIRRMLEKARGTIDLSNSVAGSGEEPPAGGETAEDIQAALAAWARQSGE